MAVQQVPGGAFPRVLPPSCPRAMHRHHRASLKPGPPLSFALQGAPCDPPLAPKGRRGIAMLDLHFISKHRCPSSLLLPDLLCSAPFIGSCSQTRQLRRSIVHAAGPGGAAVAPPPPRGRRLHNPLGPRAHQGAHGPQGSVAGLRGCIPYKVRGAAAG